MALKQRDFQEGKLHPQLMTLPVIYHIMEFTYPAYLVKLGWCSDCSAEFHGTSINNQLHLGPDLTSQIVGVLPRFRTETVAFMAYIETMFYQMHIFNKERSFLRYLLWEGVNLEKPFYY